MPLPVSLLPLLLLLSLEYAAVLLATVVDLISGLRKARLRGEKCTSHGLRRTVDKIGRYYLALFAMTLVDSMIIGSLLLLRHSGVDLIAPFPFLSTIASLALTLIEVKSICERNEDKGDFREAVRLLGRLVDRLSSIGRQRPPA